jgi:hypothetical protein
MSIHYHPIENFDTLSQEQASQILYHELVPFLEQRQIYLSQEGHHSLVLGGIDPQYLELKQAQELFDVAKVQSAFSVLQRVFIPQHRYNRNWSSYGLKHAFENVLDQLIPDAITYITNGDFIAAMLLKGFMTRFGRTQATRGKNCDFKAVFHQPYPLLTPYTEPVYIA